MKQNIKIHNLFWLPYTKEPISEDINTISLAASKLTVIKPFAHSSGTNKLLVIGDNNACYYIVEMNKPQITYLMFQNASGI